MLNQQDPQQSGQKTTVMWSQPVTDEQCAYFSKHAAKRRVYGVIMGILQMLHGSLAFAAWTSLIAWGLGSFLDAPLLHTVIAIVGLTTFHVLFRVTWSTYWYDRMDEKDETDSSIWIPIIIMCILFGTEVFGARKFFEAAVKPAEIKSDTGLIKSHESLIASIDKQESNAKTAILSAFQERIIAAEAPYTNKIASLKKRKVSNDADRKYIKSQIRSLEAQATNASAPIKAAQADSSFALTSRFQKQRDYHNGSMTVEKESLSKVNASENSRELSEKQQAGTYAWIISAALLALISLLGYAQVRINVKSGILPLRNYTVLDAHGSALERIWTAISDAFNRRSMQLAVNIHQLLSPNEAIRSFDGTIVSQPGTYNTPKGFFPPPSSKSVEEAVNEVLQKMAANPSVTLSEQDIKNEIALSLSSNGKYASMPLGKAIPSPHKAKDEGSAKDSPVPVSQLPVNVTHTHSADTESNITPEELVRYYLQELRREPANYKNPHANAQTVTNRIHSKLKRAQAAIQRLDAPIPTKLSEDFIAFLTGKLHPVLFEYGVPYEGMEELIFIVRENTQTPVADENHV